MQQMIVNGLKVDIARKIIRNLHLRVRPSSGEVMVSAPFFMSEETIRSMIVRKFAWIQRHLNQPKFGFEAPPKLRFCEGEQHWFLGQPHTLRITAHPGRPKVVRGEAQALELFIAAGSTIKQRQAVLERWYRRELQGLLAPLIEEWQVRMKVEVAQWHIKKMKTRWGTCNPQARRIWLGLDLAKKPLSQIEYVVVHELVHFFERGHNQRFKSLMDQFLPEWRSLRANLNGKASRKSDDGC